MKTRTAYSLFLLSDSLLKVRLFLQNNFFTIVAILTFFLIITAQTLWSTIHGDGAVYAWITKEMATGGVFSGKLPNWDQTHVFAEHPYLFFYFGAFFVNLFGDSDMTLKLPNFFIAALSLFAVFKAAQLKAGKESGDVKGLIAGYALILNATYIMQVSQPSLDPMAQLLAFLSVLVLVFTKSPFASGLIMGTAFLTKGLELLPNLAALALVSAYLQKDSFKYVIKSALLIAAGVLLPVLAWMLFDQAIWQGQWINTYWTRQFVNRFFSSENVNRSADAEYLLTVSRVYFVEFFILAVWFLSTDAWKRKFKDPLFLYFLSYSALNILAFLIIKKDSSQHVTGILVCGAVFVGEAVYDIWKKIGAKRLWVVPASLFLVAASYWIWYFVNADYNPDIWTIVKNETLHKNGATLPVVVRDSTGQSYGLFYTAQWYSKSDRIYFQGDADRFLIGKEVLFLSETENGQLDSARVIYQKGL